MFQVNDHFGRLQGSYLFSEIARRVNEYTGENPDREIIRLGIGDVTRPLAPVVLQAIDKATQEMADEKDLYGLRPEQGYESPSRGDQEGDYAARGVDIGLDEIFVSDGSKCDTGNIQELLSPDCKIGVTNPVYPVYVDTNVMAGRSGEFDAQTGQFSEITYIPTTAENDFVPALPQRRVDVMYLCSPNNPTGTAMTKDQLKVWVDWANETGALILFDGAYERFITDGMFPTAFMRLKARKRARLNSAAFPRRRASRVRAARIRLFPKELMGGRIQKGNKVSMNALWLRRHTTKFNGVSISCSGALRRFIRRKERS